MGNHDNFIYNRERTFLSVDKHFYNIVVLVQTDDFDLLNPFHFTTVGRLSTNF